MGARLSKNTHFAVGVGVGVVLATVFAGMITRPSRDSLSSFLTQWLQDQARLAREEQGKAGWFGKVVDNISSRVLSNFAFDTTIVNGGFFLLAQCTLKDEPKGLKFIFLGIFNRWYSCQ